MGIKRWTCVLCLAVMTGSAVLPARAQLVADVEDASELAVETASLVSPEELERWWGAAGAVICGAELWLLRNRPDLGLNPYALAAGIAGCGLAALDVMTQ